MSTLRRFMLGQDLSTTGALAGSRAFAPLPLERKASMLRSSGDHALAGEVLRFISPGVSAPLASSARAILEDAAFAVVAQEAFTQLEFSKPDARALALLAADARRIVGLGGRAPVVSARVKSTLSTWRKMERKAVAADEVFDRAGVRLLVDDEPDAYRALARLHRAYAPIAGEFDDYIARPKASGYRALHTAVNTPIGPVEFQIRTHAMDFEAEHGAAAHWRYKSATLAS